MNLTDCVSVVVVPLKKNPSWRRTDEDDDGDDDAVAASATTAASSSSCEGESSLCTHERCSSADS